MPSARSAILITVAVMGVSIAASLFSLVGPPDSGGRGRDSYGTRWNGMRAWFQLLTESGVTTERRLTPPPVDPAPGTYVLWMPDEALAAVEPVYLEHLRHWVEAGNRVLVSPAPSSDDSAGSNSRRERKATFENILRLLGVGGIEVRQMPQAESPRTSGNDRRKRIGREARETWNELTGQREFRTGEVAARATGAAVSPQRVRRLHAPLEELHYLMWNPKVVDVAGSLALDLPDDPVVVAVVPVGRGEVIVVSEAYLLMNHALAQADNAVLAYDLAADGERTVIFDEFYHGLGVRGNPLWLLTKPYYASVVVSSLIVAGLVLWRRAVALGPPIESKPATRRTVVEYVQATARFLSRSRGAPIFVLDEVRSGALQVLAERRRCHGGDASAEAVMNSLTRSAPAEAERLRTALAEIESAEALADRCTRSGVVQALQGIQRCLSPNSIK